MAKATGKTTTHKTGKSAGKTIGNISAMRDVKTEQIVGHASVGPKSSSGSRPKTAVMKEKGGKLVVAKKKPNNLSHVFGKWPGHESDAEINKALKEH